MKISDVERKLLNLLFSSNRELDSYTLFRRAKVPFSDFAASINKMKEKGLVNQSETRIQLSDEGMRLVPAMGFYSLDREWRKVPRAFKRSQLESGELYVPSLRLLDPDTFPSRNDDV